MTAAAPVIGPASSRQIGAMHALKARLGLCDIAYRDVMEVETGKRSAKALTITEAGRVIERLKVLAGQGPGAGQRPGAETASKGPRTAFTSGLPETLPAGLPTARGALEISGPFGAKLRALWISAHDLGVVRDRTDQALVHFIERQTKISHPRWLRDPADAAKAIEALKSWIAREAGVVWPARDAEPADIKRAVITAQWMRLVKLGAVRLFIAERPLDDLDRYAFEVAGRQGWCFFSDADFAAVQSALGRKLRQALKRQAGKAGRA